MYRPTTHKGITQVHTTHSLRYVSIVQCTVCCSEIVWFTNYHSGMHKENQGFLKTCLNKQPYNIGFPSNTGHKSIGMKLLALQIHSSSLNIEVVNYLKNCKLQVFHLIHCLITTIDLLPKPLGLWPPFFPWTKFITVCTNLSCFHGIYFCLLQVCFLCIFCMITTIEKGCQALLL